MDETEDKKLKELLENVANTLKQNKELTKLNGENFNLFMILNKQKDEVRTHSAFIAELLNPNGTHGLGAIFLQYFATMLAEKTSQTFYEKDELDKTQINVEHTVDKDSRLDIYMSNRDMQICIENKIYAGDQEFQLEKYKQFIDLNNYKNSLLIYLTLDGREYQPEKSKLKKNEDYICLSYKNDIINWLKDCLKESVEYPILRETIKQYIILIKSLTNQLSIVTELKSNFSEKLYNIWEQEKGGFSSIFIKDSQWDFHIGIESFNGEGHTKNLFIGKIKFGEKGKGIKNGGWIVDSIEKIWDRSTLFQKLQEFANGNEQTRENIVTEIVEKTVKFTKLLCKYSIEK